MKDKKGINIQLSIMILIILTIIALIIAFNIVFSRLSSTKKNVLLAIGKDAEIRIMQELKKGEKVVVSPSVIKLKENMNKFYVGVKNVFSEELNFKINFSLYQKNANFTLVYPVQDEFNISSGAIKIRSFLLNHKEIEKKFNKELPIIIIVNIYYNNSNNWTFYHNSVLKVEK